MASRWPEAQSPQTETKRAPLSEHFIPLKDALAIIGASNLLNVEKGTIIFALEQAAEKNPSFEAPLQQLETSLEIPESVTQRSGVKERIEAIAKAVEQRVKNTEAEKAELVVDIVRVVVEALHPDIRVSQLTPRERRRITNDLSHELGITIKESGL